MLRSCERGPSDSSVVEVKTTTADASKACSNEDEESRLTRFLLSVFESLNNDDVKVFSWKYISFCDGDIRTLYMQRNRKRFRHEVEAIQSRFEKDPHVTSSITIHTV